MNKKLFPVILTFTLFSISGCSTYNSIVPDWATIGQSEIGRLEAKMEDATDNQDFEEATRLRDEIRKLEAETESENNDSDSDDESTWWNPFSWW